MSNTRNGILAQIVIALGGTVRNPDNRNMLLEDWRDAVGGGGPATREVFNFNAVNQWISLGGNILVPAGQSIEMMVRVNNTATGSNQYLMDSALDTDPNRTAVFVTSTGTYLDGDFDSELDGQPFANGSQWPDSEFHHLKLTAVTNTNVGTLAARANGSGANFLGGVIYNIKFNGGSVNNYPVDDGWSNNPIIRNTGSGADATLINGLESGWETIPV